jgi:hypothetical protein
VAESNALTKELLELLRAAGGREHPGIDFKRDIQVRTTAQKAELAKDVALQANLPEGGNLAYGVDESGNPVGLLDDPDPDLVASILVNRLQFAPPGIDCRVVPYQDPLPGRKPVLLWIRIPPNCYTIGTCFLAEDGNLRMPIRVDSLTKYLNPAESASLNLQRDREGPPRQVARLATMSYNAEPDATVELLDSNLLPVVELPRSVWIASTKCESENDVRKVCGGDLPPFRVIRGWLYTLRPTAESRFRFSSVTSTSGSLQALDKLLRNRDRRRVVIGLLNSELVRYALRRGLIAEEDGSRLYFPPEQGQPRSITWQSLSKKATREVVGIRLRTGGTVDHWFHFAVNLRLQDLGNRFAALINPGWVFTYDGHKLLRSFEVAPVATPKMNREDNARILYNTQFWAQFLSDGNRQIEIPLASGSLRISTETVKLRVPFGIAKDRISVPSNPTSESDLPPDILWSDVAEIDDETAEEPLEKWS